MAALALKRRTPSLGTLPSVQSSSVIDTPLPSASITNKPAIQGASLYHTCRSVLDKLQLVDGMAVHLDVEMLPTLPISSSTTDGATPSLSNSPLSKLWGLCRRGAPLCTLFNALNPDQPLKVDLDPALNQVNSCKASVYHFIVGCRQQLNFKEEDVFTVTDLYLDDTNGFVKVVNTVNKILQQLEERGVISVRSSNRNSDPIAPKETRDKVIFELLETERKYVQDLETLQNYMRELQTQKVLSADTVHYLFGNLNALVDFQRRFLIQMEDTAEQPTQEQRFGMLFVQVEEAFSVYEPYCSNYYSAQDLVVQETPRLQRLADILHPTYELPSLLIKPVQRICKYPLLLAELNKFTRPDWPYKAEMEEGLEAMKRVAEKVNETQRRHENMQMVEELKKRVYDWKGLCIEGHGCLLLQEKLRYVNKDSNREMHAFFFEGSILFCKESKSASKNRLAKANSITMKKKRRGSLQPKVMLSTSRIYDVQNTSENAEWSLTIQLQGRELEEISLEFRIEEQLKLWIASLERIKTANHNAMANAIPIPVTPTQMHMHNEAPSFIDYEDEDDEEDSFDDDEDDMLQQTPRSRSNSLSAHLFNSLAGRPKMSRNNSSEVSQLKLGMPNMRPIPGMNLSPLPRTSSSTSITSPGEYSFYPASPPPSNPSSPTSSSRVSSASGRRDNLPLAEIASKFMAGGDVPTPLEENRQFPLSLPINRSQSHSTSGLGMTPTTPTLQHQQQQQHNRLRSQSSPNIQKNHRAHQWDNLPQLPTTPRLAAAHTTLLSAVEPTASMNVVRNVASTPRLSDMTISHSASLTPSSVKIKLVYNDGIYVIVAEQAIAFRDLLDRVEHKIRLVTKLGSSDMLRLKYQDEDGDFITINSDDDVQMAFESYGNSNTVNLFVSL